MVVVVKSHCFYSHFLGGNFPNFLDYRLVIGDCRFVCIGCAVVF